MIQDVLMWWWYLMEFYNSFQISRLFLYSFNYCSRKGLVSILREKIIFMHMENNTVLCVRYTCVTCNPDQMPNYFKLPWGQQTPLRPKSPWIPGPKLQHWVVSKGWDTTWPNSPVFSNTCVWRSVMWRLVGLLSPVHRVHTIKKLKSCTHICSVLHTTYYCTSCITKLINKHLMVILNEVYFASHQGNT